MPKAIKQIAATHHGTTSVKYFLFKAESEGKEVNAKDFQYAGPIPKNKEEAIIMFADSVEAAVTSLDEKSEENIRNMIKKIIFNSDFLFVFAFFLLIIYSSPIFSLYFINFYFIVLSLILFVNVFYVTIMLQIYYKYHFGDVFILLAFGDRFNLLARRTCPQISSLSPFASILNTSPDNILFLYNVYVVIYELDNFQALLKIPHKSF